MIEEWSCRQKLGQVTILPSQPLILLHKHEGLSPESGSGAPFACHAVDDVKWTGGLVSVNALL